MNRRIVLTTLFFMIIAGCAPYKQLRPKTDLSDGEQGFLELRKDEKNNFELKKDKKYYIQFPAPQQDNFYLVLSIPEKKALNSFLTSSMTDKKRPGEKVADETPYPDTISAYPVHKSKASAYYWFIDQVPQDMVLRLNYRYVPQWRYRFETRYSRLKQTLEKNLVDRTPYESCGPSNHFEGFNFVMAVDTVERHTAELDKIHNELLDIEKLLPATIVNSSDPAYKNYVTLRQALEDEMNFQANYLAVLGFFNNEYQCRGSTLDLLGKVDDFIAFFNKKDKIADNVVKASQEVLSKRLDEIKPFYDKRLGEKDDSKPLDEQYFRLKSFGRIPELYTAAGLSMPQDFGNLFNYVNAFNAKSQTVSSVNDSMKAVITAIKLQPGMPDDNFFSGQTTRMVKIQGTLPNQFDSQYGQYFNYACSRKLNEEIGALAAEVSKRLDELRLAQSIVPQLNVLKAQQDYSGMLGILRQNLGLGFLIDKYRSLDKMSIDAQTRTIRASLDNSTWAQAEAGLAKLHADQNFLDPSSMIPIKELAVRDFEDSLYTRIDRVTRARVNKFCEDRAGQLENIDSLYSDSVFLPVYNVTFSSGSKNDLLVKRDALIADLAKMKENEFPAKAIKLLYDEFTKNPQDNGVLKARAIVAHGAHYRGTDKEIKMRVAECDPYVAKLISKPKDYRRVFALPVTSKQRGKNKYVVRLNVNIPTDAVFPVYDVNMKLPREVAQNAASEQWYDDITLNKKQLKNEGRFSIGSPSPSNDYECQITPVQMNKDQSNILEVTFSYDAFKPLIVSVMVQKPIIKKN